MAIVYFRDEDTAARGNWMPPVDVYEEKKFSGEVKEDRYRRIERSYGQFSRSFTLPTTVDSTKVSAEYKNGVLTVKLPFREEARPRTINVEVAA